MKTYLPDRGLAAPEGDRFPPVAQTYLISALLPSSGSDVSSRSQRELRTLATGLDLIGQGYVAEAADLFMMRFQAVETAGRDGWGSARHLEGLPETEVSAVGPEARREAARLEERELRNKELVARHRGGR